MDKVVELFLNYVKVHTMSDELSETYPSTACQWDLLSMLLGELNALGLTAQMDEYGYVTARLAANCDCNATLALLAHVDTSPAVSGKDVKAQILPYSGKPLLLNDKEQIYLSAEDYPVLDNYIGQHIIATDGTTLLGADDKAGIAEIMALLHKLMENPSLPHPHLVVVFSPDEEVGRGVDYLDVNALGADYGYTVDGGAVGEINYECFNAASCVVQVNGVSIHPGSAYGKMINALDVFHEFHALVPPTERPVSTRGYEGFYMLESVEGSIESVTARYILRDHDPKKLEEKKRTMQAIGADLCTKYRVDTVEVRIKDSYRNMREIVEQHPALLARAEEAYRQIGVTPFVEPIRGGTDGAALTQRGLPCPNLATGGHNAHSRFEFISCESMAKMVDMLTALCALWCA